MMGYRRGKRGSRSGCENSRPSTNSWLHCTLERLALQTSCIDARFHGRPCPLESGSSNGESWSECTTVSPGWRERTAFSSAATASEDFILGTP